MPRPRLLLVHEPESACAARLTAQGFAPAHVAEITSYLAQSTDLSARMDELHAAFDALGLDFVPVDLDAAAPVIASADPGRDLVWTLTDGIAYFRGGAAPALARLHGLRTVGSDDSLFALCQDKFRSGAVLAALGLPVPPAGLARNGEWIVPPPPAPLGWFVKPNRLGSKIGIWEDAHCHDPATALDISRRVFAAYRDDVIVQAYVAGRNARASYLDVQGRGDVADLGVAFVDSGGDFQTMADSLALYGETGAQARASGTYEEPALLPVAVTHPKAEDLIRKMAARLMAGLGLRDVFSIDLRIDAEGAVHLIEFEVCPGLPCFDFDRYITSHWRMSLGAAMATLSARRLGLPG